VIAWIWENAEKVGLLVGVVAILVGTFTYAGMGRDALALLAGCALLALLRLHCGGLPPAPEVRGNPTPMTPDRPPRHPRGECHPGHHQPQDVVRAVVGMRC
jgi:hypothetical protein